MVIMTAEGRRTNSIGILIIVLSLRRVYLALLTATAAFVAQIRTHSLTHWRALAVAAAAAAHNSLSAA